MKIEIYLATLTQEFYHQKPEAKPETRWWPAVHRQEAEGDSSQSRAEEQSESADQSTRWWPAVHRQDAEPVATRWWPAVHRLDVEPASTRWWPAVHRQDVEPVATRWWPAVHRDQVTKDWPSVYSSKPDTWKNATSGPVRSANQLGRVIIRDEEFGSIIFDPVSQVVLKADKEATEAVKAIARGEEMKEVFSKFDTSENDEKEFKNVLKKIGLWEGEC